MHKQQGRCECQSRSAYKLPRTTHPSSLLCHSKQVGSSHHLQLSLMVTRGHHLIATGSPTFTDPPTEGRPCLNPNLTMACRSGRQPLLRPLTQRGAIRCRRRLLTSGKTHRIVHYWIVSPGTYRKYSVSTTRIELFLNRQSHRQVTITPSLGVCLVPAREKAEAEGDSSGHTV